MNHLGISLAACIALGPTGSIASGSEEATVLHEFVTRCVTPLEAGERPDLSGLPLVSSNHAGGRELFRKDLPGLGSIQEVLTSNAKFGGCTVDSIFDVDAFNVDKLEVEFSAWANEALESGRYAKLLSCKQDGFSFFTTIDSDFERPNGLKIRVILGVSEELNMFLLIVAEADELTSRCAEGSE